MHTVPELHPVLRGALVLVLDTGWKSLRGNTCPVLDLVRVG